MANPKRPFSSGGIITWKKSFIKSNDDRRVRLKWMMMLYVTTIFCLPFIMTLICHSLNHNIRQCSQLRSMCLKGCSSMKYFRRFKRSKIVIPSRRHCLEDIDGCLVEFHVNSKLVRRDKNAIYFDHLNQNIRANSKTCCTCNFSTFICSAILTWGLVGLSPELHPKGDSLKMPFDSLNDVSLCWFWEFLS